MNYAQKLKQIRVSKDLSQEDMAKELAISQQVYSNLENGKTKKIDHKIVEYITTNFVENQSNVVNEGHESYTNKRFNLKTSTTRKIPFYDAEVAAGNINSEILPINAPAGTIDIGDLLNDSEAAIRIYGNSMIPNYPPGCVIGLAKCISNFIEPGEVYVIETSDRRIIKRLFYKNDDTESKYFTCYSDNIEVFEGGPRAGKLSYPPFDILKMDIINIFFVTGVIKRNSNSIIINRN